MTQTNEIDFMNELEAAARLRPSFASNLLLISISAFVLVFIIWSSLSQIEEITHGVGQVVPTREIQVVQSLEGGILGELLVGEGDLVKKNQVLMRISDVTFSSEERGAEARLIAMKAKRSRLQAEAQGIDFVVPEDVAENERPVFANELALYGSRQQELTNAVAILKDKREKAAAEIAETQAQAQRLKDSKGLLAQELEITSKMVAQQAVPKLEEIRLRRELSDLSGQLSANAEKLTGLQAELSATENQLKDQNDKFRSQALGELTEVEAELAPLQEGMKAIGDRVFRTELRAPVDGIVNNIALKTIGGVVEPAHKLIEIVPVDDELKIIARVRPSDIAFLKIGQEANVKITAYDPQRYGSLKGHLVRIGANSVSGREGETFFEIEVRTEKNYLGTEENRLPITPGMVADTEIITGKRSIMSYLMKPVLRLKDRALRER